MTFNDREWIKQNRNYLIEQSKMLQAIIARMDNHSVEIKKFGGTIWSALMGFGFSNDKPSLFGLALTVLIFFMLLDVYYLHLERRFRDKFTQLMEVLGKNESEILDNSDRYSKNFVKLDKLCFLQGYFILKSVKICSSPNRHFRCA